MNYRGLRLVKNVQHLNRLEYNKNYSSYEVDTYVDLFLRSNFDWSIFRIPNLNKAYRIRKDIESLQMRESKETEWKELFLDKICDEYEKRYYLSKEEKINAKMKEYNFSFFSMCIYYMAVFDRYVEEIRRRVSSPYYYYGITDIYEHYINLKDRVSIPRNTPDTVFVRIESKDYFTKTLKPKFVESDTKRDIVAKYRDIICSLKGDTSISQKIVAHYDEIVMPKYEVIDGYKYLTLKVLSCGIPLAIGNERNSDDNIRIYRGQWTENGRFTGIIAPYENKDSNTFAKSMLNPDWLSYHYHFWQTFVKSEDTKIVVNFTNQMQENIDIDLIEYKFRSYSMEYKDIFDIVTK